jgi:hypothetical protein
MDLESRLEGLVDESGLGAVLAALAAVCRGKAEHVRSVWNDRELAREWGKAARVVEGAAAKAEKVDVG